MIKNQKSFTLIELLVAAAIFSLIGGMAAGAFFSGLQAQRKSLSSQKLLSQTSYLMEYMSRALRMARKELAAPGCLSTNGLNYEKTRAGKGLKFKNYQGVCQEFFWDTAANRLKENKGGTENYLTSADLGVNSFNIGPSDSWDQNDNDQPRVTFFLEIQGTGEKPEQKPVIKIQTTVSQRNPDIER